MIIPVLVFAARNPITVVLVLLVVVASSIVVVVVIREKTDDRLFMASSLRPARGGGWRLFPSFSRMVVGA
jgi:hypothetical protein